MKCRVCGKPANISLRAYNTALCAEDFTSFFEKRVLTTINKYHLIQEGDTPIVAVSGGKDSLALWHIINKLGFAADGIYVDLGIKGYSDTSLSKIKIMAGALKRKVFVFHLRDTFEKGIEELSRVLKRVPCSACGMIKRYVMNRICMDESYTVLMTGHNLDDEASALLGNILYWKDEYLWKKDVVLEGRAGHLSKKVKPLFLCSERETAAYAIINGIDYVYEECPFSVDAKSLVYKGILNNLEESSPATKIAFIKGYLKMVKKIKAGGNENNPPQFPPLAKGGGGGFYPFTPVPKRFCSGKGGMGPPVARLPDGQGQTGGFTDGRKHSEDSDCAVCGYPAYGGKCSMCRLMERIGAKNTVCFEEYNPCSLDSCQEIVT